MAAVGCIGLLLTCHSLKFAAHTAILRGPYRSFFAVLRQSVKSQSAWDPTGRGRDPPATW
ncbi:hypothetical protein BRAS3843_1730041 [Bradyrhizobium sp. STM 3843]|nr:hypothetical protein BRAS3843_1730041 [Bradyrhizobium sp. STM 3843]